MGRIALIIIVLGGIIAAMLPAGPNAPSPPIANHVGGTFSAESTPHVVRGGSSFNATTSPNSVPGQGITLDRAPDGHFYADAQVNGTSIRFLVDTGASGVALSTEDARRAGLPYFSSEFTAVGRGASGEVRGKLVTLDRVTLGGKSVENVSGAILEGSEISLLGQSFLGRMASIEITGDRMVIR